jgi:hypothetical protein
VSTLPPRSGLLVPDGSEADEAIARFLDRAEATRLYDGKRLTPQDLADLEAIYGELPIEPIPGVDG